MTARLLAGRPFLGEAGLVVLAGVFGLFVVRLSVARPIQALAVFAGLAAVVVASRNLTIALAIFTVLTFFGRIPAGASLVKPMTFVLLVSWLGVLAGRRWSPVLFRDHPLLTYGVFLLLAWAGASVLWAADPGATESGVFRLAQMLLLLFLVFAAIGDRRDLRLFGWSFVTGVVLTSVAGLLGLAPAGTAADELSGRFGGALGNPNNLAAVVLPALALAAAIFLGSRRPFERWLVAGCGGVLLLTLFMTESRGGLVGLLVMCLASVLFAGRLRARATLAVLIVAVAGFAYFATASPSARERVTDYSAADSTGRADLWDVAWRMTSDHPLQGVGLDNFITVAPDYLQRNLDIRRSDLFLRPQPTEVHNTYLNVLAELGFPGLLIFTALLAGAFGIAVRATRTLARVGDVEGELLARGFVIGASGMLTAYVFFSAQFEKQLWLILGGLIALSTVARAARRQAASE